MLPLMPLVPGAEIRRRNMEIASLSNHLDQLPILAKLHHAEWSAVSRFNTVDGNRRRCMLR